MGRPLSPRALAFACLLGCAAQSPTSQPRTAAGPPLAPHIDVGTEAEAMGALRSRLDALVHSPHQLSGALADSKRRFPEGDLLPATLAAIGYVNVGEPDAAATLIEAARAAVRERVGQPLSELTTLQGQGTYMANLNLALAHHCVAAGPERFAAIHEPITNVLRAAIAAEDGGPIASYPDQRWPVDTVVAMASVALHDECHGRAPDAEMLAGHQRWTANAGTDPELGLPYARVDTARPMEPRGSDLSWRILLLTRAAPAYAKELQQRYLAFFWRETETVTGFTEWPGGRHAPDLDSGPIVNGIGAAASTFGIGTCAAFGDRERRERLLAQLPRGRMLVEQAHGATISGIRIDARYVTGSLMGDATLFYALTQDAAEGL